MVAKCAWCLGDPMLEKYHDDEWGLSVHDPSALFECLCLEGMQAGLSWITVLRKRENYRRIFHAFDPVAMARMSDEHLETALLDAGIVRNRLKVFALRRNARAFLDFQWGPAAFSDFLWSFAPRSSGERPSSYLDIPVRTPESEAMSKALAKRGFTFVWPTICQAFMQAVGMRNDHESACFKL